MCNKGLVVGGFDVVYDCVGSSATLTDSLRWTRAGGAVQIVGLHFAPMAKIDLTPVWFHLKDYKEAIRVASAKGREKAIKVVLEQD